MSRISPHRQLRLCGHQSICLSKHYVVVGISDARKKLRLIVQKMPKHCPHLIERTLGMDPLNAAALNVQVPFTLIPRGKRRSLIRRLRIIRPCLQRSGILRIPLTIKNVPSGHTKKSELHPSLYLKQLQIKPIFTPKNSFVWRSMSDLSCLPQGAAKTMRSQEA
jgi:hypothetical protein